MAFKMKGSPLHRNFGSALKHSTSTDKDGNPVYHTGYDWNIHPDKHTHANSTSSDKILTHYKGKEKGKLYTYEEKLKEEELENVQKAVKEKTK